MELTRRRFLVGGAAVLLGGGAAAYGLVESGVLSGQSTLDERLGRCDTDGSWPRTAPGRVERASFRPAARGREVDYVLSWPPGDVTDADLPLVLVLHGSGSIPDHCVSRLHLDAFLAAHVGAGGRPFALACADGGDRYWHPRSDGDDPLRMLTHEFLPMLRGQGLSTAPMGVLGWSMGGYGALLWARLSGRGELPADVTTRAVVAESPALFRVFSGTTPGAFDSPADFAHWGNLLSEPGVDTDSTALRVDCGRDDVFAAVTEEYRSRFTPRPAGGLTEGCHTMDYWRSRAAAQLAFLGPHLG